jgi:hypothetical protein
VELELRELPLPGDITVADARVGIAVTKALAGELPTFVWAFN